MTTKTYYINSPDASYNDNEIAWLPSKAFNEGIIADPAGVLGLVPTENAVPDMDVLVGVGTALVEIVISGRTFKVVVETDAVETLTAGANVSGVDRVDAIIVRIDVTATPNALKTNMATIELIAGSGITALTDGAIDTAVGADGWYRLADVTVADSATAISNSDISRTGAKVGINSALDMSDPVNPALSQRDVTTGLTDVEQADSTIAIAVGEADSAGNNAILAQSYIPSDDGIKGVSLYKKADTGTFTGDVVITLEADVAGVPSGTPLATQTILNADWLLLNANAEFTTDFVSQYDGLEQTATYWIVITPSTNDNANHPNLGGAIGDLYTDGGAYTENVTDGWNEIAGTDIYFKTLALTANQLVTTNAEGIIDPQFISVETSRLEGVGIAGDFLYVNDSYMWDALQWVVVSSAVNLFGFNYAQISETRVESNVARVMGEMVGLTFTSSFVLKQQMRAVGASGEKTCSWCACANTGAGLGNGVAKEVPEGSTNKGLGFRENSSGNMYARTVNGAGYTDVLISGITITDKNDYRVEFDAGVEARFYVNGVLKATITTNLPSSGTTYIGHGSRGASTGRVLHVAQYKTSY